MFPLKLHAMSLPDWRLVPANSSKIELSKGAVAWQAATESAVRIE